MTWIVGVPVLFGYAVALSAIRVTFQDGTERDCLQKIYPVGPYLAAGFAGSVAIGFAMVQRLIELLHGADRNSAWDPTEVAKWWPQDAQSVSSRFPDSERSHRSQILLLGAHPTRNAGDIPWPRCYVYKFSSPTFAVLEGQLHEAVSIGSGTDIKVYRERLRSIHHEEALEQLETGRSGGMARGLMHYITRTIEDAPTAGISRHLHICVVTRGQIEIGTNDRRQIGGTGANDLAMPRVATSLQELHRIVEQAGSSADGAAC